MWLVVVVFFFFLFFFLFWKRNCSEKVFSVVTAGELLLILQLNTWAFRAA